jgi:general secretion pathway protein H
MKRNKGFTLVELLVVMGIMVLLMGISTMGLMGIRRGAELRGGARSVRSTLMLARQYAVTKRQEVQVGFTANSMTVSFLAGGSTNRTTYFSPGITISKLPDNNPLRFMPNGGLAVAGSFNDKIEISEKTGIGDGKKTIDIWLLTGVTKEN